MFPYWFINLAYWRKISMAIMGFFSRFSGWFGIQAFNGFVIYLVVFETVWPLGWFVIWSFIRSASKRIIFLVMHRKVGPFRCFISLAYWRPLTLALSGIVSGPFGWFWIWSFSPFLVIYFKHFFEKSWFFLVH